jgi:NAD(P)-dependent dehydrogenase (short-subunit alcohol dehydrogenase family)
MQRILITGASRGIGLELARQYLAQGEQVFAGARNPEKATGLQELKTKYPDRLFPIALDVAEATSIEKSYETVREQVGGLEVLINNAAINAYTDDGSSAQHNRLGQLDSEAMLGMFQINSVAPLMIVQRYLDLLKAGKQAKIVNITSQSGSLADQHGNSDYSYCASKAALNMLTRILAFDVMKFGILAVMVHPGWVRTDMGGPSATLTPEASVKGILKLIGRLTPKEAGRFFDWNGAEHRW